MMIMASVGGGIVAIRPRYWHDLKSSATNDALQNARKMHATLGRELGIQDFFHSPFDNRSGQ